MGAIFGDDYDLTFDGDQIDAAIAAAQSAAAANGILECDGSGNFSARGVDTNPTTNSTKLVTSGGVRSAITSAKNSVKPYIAKTTATPPTAFINALSCYESGIPVYVDHVVSLGSGKSMTYRMQLNAAYGGTVIDELYFGGVVETTIGESVKRVALCCIKLVPNAWGDFLIYPAQPATL